MLITGARAGRRLVGRWVRRNYESVPHSTYLRALHRRTQRYITAAGWTRGRVWCRARSDGRAGTAEGRHEPARTIWREHSAAVSTLRPQARRCLPDSGAPPPSGAGTLGTREALDAPRFGILARTLSR